MVEIDPYDPNFVPRKRTALGRAKHEAATCALANSGQVVVYTGDDQQFDYVYKFVSDGVFNPGLRADNFDLLDKGTLYVAKFRDNGTGEWIALNRTNPILAAMFKTDGEILIKTRLAADAVGATAMDRPEDVQPNPVNGRVYLTMTNNSRAHHGRRRPRQRQGQPADAELQRPHHRAARAERRLRGDPVLVEHLPAVRQSHDQPAHRSERSHPGSGFERDVLRRLCRCRPSIGKIASPDNIAFDTRGNLWIATDGQPSSVDIGEPNDAIHVVPTAGPDRGYLRQFLSAPKGAEVCGPEFSVDDRTLFCAIQHPGENGGVPNDTSTWPDRKAFARPSVVVGAPQGRPQDRRLTPTTRKQPGRPQMRAARFAFGRTCLRLLGCYLRIRFGVGVCVGGACEIANVSQEFQPSGRCSAANSL